MGRRNNYWENKRKKKEQERKRRDQKQETTSNKEMHKEITNTHKPQKRQVHKPAQTPWSGKGIELCNKYITEKRINEEKLNNDSSDVCNTKEDVREFMPNLRIGVAPKSSHRDWHEAYVSQLIEMHRIVATTIDERYAKNRIAWSKNKKVVDNLSNLIYQCSSKIISPYMDLPWEEIRSKNL